MDILKTDEATPASWPVIAGLSEGAQALDQAALWQRIESYIAHRFAARQVVWTLEGGEDESLRFPLTPVSGVTAEKWEGSAWVSVTLPDGPLGHVLPSDGIFRITATVGAGPVPAAVSEAFRRLAEYAVEIGSYGPRTGRAGATGTVFDVGTVKFSNERWATWAARAMDLSGAADLLRPYRRA